MLTPDELAAFREAAYQAMGTQELIEYLNKRQLNGDPITPAIIDKGRRR